MPLSLKYYHLLSKRRWDSRGVEQNPKKGLKTRPNVDFECVLSDGVLCFQQDESGEQTPSPQGVNFTIRHPIYLLNQSVRMKMLENSLICHQIYYPLLFEIKLLITGTVLSCKSIFMQKCKSCVKLTTEIWAFSIRIRSLSTLSCSSYS